MSALFYFLTLNIPLWGFMCWASFHFYYAFFIIHCSSILHSALLSVSLSLSLILSKVGPGLMKYEMSMSLSDTYLIPGYPCLTMWVISLILLDRHVALLSDWFFFLLLMFIFPTRMIWPHSGTPVLGNKAWHLQDNRVAPPDLSASSFAAAWRKHIVLKLPSSTTRWRMEVTHEHECRHQISPLGCLPNTLSTDSMPMLRGCLDKDHTVGLCGVRWMVTLKPAMEAGVAFSTPQRSFVI